jgi:hypothetical protein
MRAFIPALIVALGLSLWPTLPSHSQPGCQLFRTLVPQWKREYVEIPAHMGVERKGTRIVHFLNKGTGAWTIVRVWPNTRRACVIASGYGWEVADAITERFPL